jgi:hypothetical protein
MILQLFGVAEHRLILSNIECRVIGPDEGDVFVVDGRQARLHVLV